MGAEVDIKEDSVDVLGLQDRLTTLNHVYTRVNSIHTQCYRIMKKKPKAAIIILDCCREFKYQAKQRTMGNLESQKKFKNATVIAFSCEPNGTASDGINGQGRYTEMHL